MRLSALGDVIISASFLGFLGEIKKAFLTHKGETLRIEWFIDKRFADILVDSPVIDCLHVLDFKKNLRSISGLLSLKKYCKNCGEYDVVLDLQGLIKSGIVTKMLDSKEFIGFSFKSARESLASFFYSKKIHISYHANILERNFKLIIESIKILEPENGHSNLLQSDLKTALRLRKNGFSYNKNTLDSTLFKILENKCYRILFVLEASIKEKIYPAKQFIELARKINTLDSINTTFFLTFKDNIDSANEIFNALKLENIECIKLHNLDFNSLKYMLSNMNCAIGGDTGLTYLAWALGVPTISLYGNKDSKNTESKDSKKNKKSSKNMRNTELSRILLGNPYLVSQSDNFEIESISPNDIFNVFKNEILKI